MALLPTPAAVGELLWHPALHAQLAYQERAILNAGFASGPVTMELIEDGSADKELPSASAAAIVAFVRVIGLKTGDAQRLVIKDPVGNVIAENRASQLEGTRRSSCCLPAESVRRAGWDRGTYKATYVVERDGRVVLQKDLELTL